jgi:quercetin dioxygenase-like cupin family protein
MKRAYVPVVLAVGALLWVGPQWKAGWADHRDEATMEASLYSPANTKWQEGPASLPAGAKIAILEGDPTKEGPFTFRVKVPDGYRIPPHVHPKTERVTVISGTFRLGMGEKFDAAALCSLPAGTYGFWPAGMKHFVQAEGETILQFHGTGPWQIVYLNPADDPRRAGR